MKNFALFIVVSLMLPVCPRAMAQSTNRSSARVASNVPTAPSQQNDNRRTLSGVVYTQQNELAPGVIVIVRSTAGKQQTTTDAEGAFRLTVPNQTLTVSFEGKNINPAQRIINPGAPTENLQIRIEYVVPPVHENVVIVSNVLEPAIERRNETVYNNTLFARDDQLIETLNGGINAGQHEGGGKSLEVRRFGYNLDHGGVGGGLKILVDNIQQNQTTQGHGQGYLGQLKSLTPELVQDVDIVNGPFSAQYGDFSGLGVVHIRQRESLPNVFTVRVQGGSFDSFRTFLAYSPTLEAADSFVAYEGSRTDGPFLNPLRYRRDNLTGNYTRRIGEREASGFRLNVGRNNFFSSGQIPLDEVEAGRLDRFGFVDPFNGGRVRSGIFGAYYRKEGESGNTFKVDGFLARSLFDLFSNFTFFLNDEINGDEIQQHDSRLQQGVNTQYLQPYKLFGRQALLIVGGNFLANQINVGLSKTIERNPFEVVTQAHANVTNVAGYIQQSIDLFNGRVHLEGGLRYDYFRFSADGINTTRIAGGLNSAFAGTRGAGRLQSKANISYTPTDKLPLVFYFNYGRGISSQDARGVVGGFLSESTEDNEPTPVPDAPGNTPGPPVATTDFHQLGMSYNTRRFSLSTDLFLINQSNQQVYIPDDGSVEFAGPSRSYGYEAKTSIQLFRNLSFNAGLTQVSNAYFRNTNPRVYVDSAPHTVANGSLVLSDYRGFNGSLRYRHISSYRLDGEDASIRAAGHDVLDFSMSRRIRSWLDFNLTVDNLTNKRYFETQNYFESRLRPGDPIISRVHATPGYPFGVTVGLTFRVKEK